MKNPDLHIMAEMSLTDREATPLTLGSNRHQLHSFAGDKVKCFVNVGDLVDSHLASFRFGQTFTWMGKSKEGDG